MQPRHGSTLPGVPFVLLFVVFFSALAAQLGCYEGTSGEPDDGVPQGRPGPAAERGPLSLPLELDALSPNPAPGGVEFALRVTGAGFGPDAVVVVEGVPLPTSFLSSGELVARSGPRPRGSGEVFVRRGEHHSPALALQVDNAAPHFLVVPSEVHVAEDQPLALTLTVADLDDPGALRVFAAGLPPGALWDEAGRVLRFTPDFIQGGARHTITLLADDGRARAEASFDLVVDDTIQAPEPIIVDTEPLDSKGYVRYTLSQSTDDYLDSPGHAGRSFAAIVTVPTDPPGESVPVRVGLHGIGAPAPSTLGSASEIRIAPHDPDNTYWWGYASSLPEGPPSPGGVVPDYTVRRVLHLVEWVLRSFPEADPARVYVFGSSMGGAGAMSLGLLRGRHFAYADARLGQAIPRNHRPSRREQLSGLWGSPELALESGRGGPAWDFMDLTRALAESPEAREQFIFLKHSKDDPTIHFGAAVLPSPLTGSNLYQALQDARVGHFAVWDEGGHGPPDPVLDERWWSSSWAPMSAPDASLRNDGAFPAFTFSSLDDDPGTGQGNGKQAWSTNAGYAGDPALPGDCGWDGELAGAIGRFLRWDSTTLVDTFDRFQIDLRVIDSDDGPSPGPGYPSTGDDRPDDLPALVDVTPRRTQAFRCRPGERVMWSFGQLRGELVAADDGSVTVPELLLTSEWSTLVLRRASLVAE